MKIGGPLGEQNAARLLSAAALLDLMFVGFLQSTIQPTLKLELGLRQTGLALPAALYLMLLLCYWLLCEGLLGGHSFGRFVMRLQMRDKQGRPVSAVRRSTRALKKVLSLGLTGLNPNAAARYDKAAGVVWYSPIAPGRAKPIGLWRLAVMTGPDKGKFVEFGKVPGLKSSQQIKIGREQGWADLVLGRSEKASGRHCVLRVERNGDLMIRDTGTDGKGSSNGTSVGHKRIKPGQWVPLGPEGRFDVAGTALKVLR